MHSRIIATSLQHRVLPTREWVKGVVNRHSSKSGSVRTVLKNFQRHTGSFTRLLDKFASGAWFDGWKEAFEVDAETSALRDPPIVRARTWLLTTGWRRCGLVPVVAHD